MPEHPAVPGRVLIGAVVVVLLVAAAAVRFEPPSPATAAVDSLRITDNSLAPTSNPAISALTTTASVAPPTYSNETAATPAPSPAVVAAALTFPRAQNGWEQRLYTPTYVTEQLGYWWIVDCWHHRVLYRRRQANETDADIDAVRDFVGGWKKLKVANQSWLIIPHSLASDGAVVVIESSIGGSADGTEHSVLVFAPVARVQRELAAAAVGAGAADAPAWVTGVEAPAGGVYGADDDFVLVQRLPACAPPRANVRRPHRVLWDGAVRAFFLYITSPAHLARFDRLDDAAPVAAAATAGDNTAATAAAPFDAFAPVQGARAVLRQAFCKPLQHMGKIYARSIALAGSDLIITFGPRFITRIAHRDITNATVIIPRVGRYRGPGWKVSAGAMNDVRWIAGWWYLTQTHLCAVYRQRDLEPSANSPPLVVSTEQAAAVSRLRHAERYKMHLLNIPLKVCAAHPMSTNPPAASVALLSPNDTCVGSSVATPYFVEQIGRRVYVPHIFHCSGILSFVPTDNAATPVSDYRRHFGSAAWADTYEDVVQRGAVW